MAKKWKSLWENYSADGSDKTKKSAELEAHKKWYYADENNAEEKERTVIGFNTSYTDDDIKSDTDYGGYGYSGYGSYDSFDDSDSDWYRRGKFNYRRQADYSPSSQFRTFSGRYTYYSSSDDEAKNKAIRALRNLTRSANTIIDKTGGGQQSFAVQFSSGADSNGASAELAEEKRRVVYVCPDDLLATKTPEDEDACIDALTGFVLLRVQISQDVTQESVQQINATGLHTVGFRAADCLFNNEDKLCGINAEKFSRDVTDDYLAGLLAKSMLARLARRRVVANWGGFAPYFVRHAKKFAAVREHLEKAAMSVERVVGVMGYNMLADESQIELPEEINALASKHLGVEIEPANLLDVCRKLIAELRQFMTTAEVPVLAGPIETALAEMMQQAKAAQETAESGTSEMRAFLSSIAGAMGAAAEAGNSMTDAELAAGAAETATLENVKATQSVAQLLKQLAQAVKDFELADSHMKSANSDDGARLAQAAKIQLSYASLSRPAALGALKKAGVPGAEEVMSALQEPSAFGRDDGARIEKFKNMLKQLAEKTDEFVKKSKKTVKADTIARMNEMIERLKNAETAVSSVMQKINDLIEQLQTTPPKTADVSGSEVAGGIATLRVLADMQALFKSKLQSALELVPQEIENATNARGITTIQKAMNNAVYATTRAFGATGHCFYENYAMRTTAQMSKLTKEMVTTWNDRLAGTPTEEVVKTAVNNTMASTTLTDAGFMATMLDAFMQQKLQKLIDADGNELAEAVKKLGCSLTTLDRLVRALKNMRNGGKSAPNAEKIGAQTAATLAKLRAEQDPTDRHLFGEQIESVTKILTGESIGHVNSEARNAAEEEYVAYLDHANCRPKVVTRDETGDWRSSGTANKLTVIKQIKKRNKGAIEQIRNALQFQSGKRTLETYGLRSGDLDEGSLHKLNYDCENIWAQKTVSKLPDVAVGILVDQSGSMSGTKIEQAREICITLAEAIRKIAGVRLYVYGHTANVSGDDVTIYEHYTPAMGSNLQQLGGIRAHSNNYDGYAIKDVAKRLSADEAKKKYLFVIADGLPAGHGYGGESAAKHVTSVCKFTRDRLKIGTYAFAVGTHGHQQAKFRQQYGDKHVVFVDNVRKCLPQIVRFLRNALQQERKLVGAAD